MGREQCSPTNHARASHLSPATFWATAGRQVAASVDVLYQTRIQRERFQDRPEEYEQVRVTPTPTLTLVVNDASALWMATGDDTVESLAPT